jgi:hypothetical protein
VIETIALAKDTAIEPNLVGDRRIFSVTEARRRNIVPRRHISEITLHNQHHQARGTYDSAATGDIPIIRNFATTGSNLPCFSLQWNNEDSRPTQTASNA